MLRHIIVIAIVFEIDICSRVSFIHRILIIIYSCVRLNFCRVLLSENLSCSGVKLAVGHTFWATTEACVGNRQPKSRKGKVLWIRRSHCEHHIWYLWKFPHRWKPEMQPSFTAWKQGDCFQACPKEDDVWLDGPLMACCAAEQCGTATQTPHFGQRAALRLDSLHNLMRCPDRWSLI